MRRAARVDQNQADIVRGLREIGASVQPLHDVGSGCPDLLVGWRGQSFCLEVKDGTKAPSDRRLTPDQVEWHRQWAGHVAVVKNVREAYLAIGAEVTW